ncbi:calmodulin-2 [Spodoptera frugiperda]|uniref:Calmodulin-2 n=1 Tax=Spodoptera frugiperda TaxID=7108 RepID=A0A9R0D9I1_SPOFR|nr:calmodulin-2 [Spodoptera frugiperda]
MAPKAKKPAKKDIKKKSALKLAGPPPKPKKIPPPPACFTNEDIQKYKEIFRLFDEEQIDKVPLNMIPQMLRKIGLNPKTAELNQMYATFLEDDLVDTVEFHEFLQMIEAKVNFGDDFEIDITRAIAALGHDDEETGFVDFEVFKGELMEWGEPLLEIEFMDWTKLAIRDKSYTQQDGRFCYGKFVENMNNRDMRFFKEPINYFKLDQKTLAELAIKKAQAMKEEQERRELEKKARDEARRQKMIADGLLLPDEPLPVAEKATTSADAGGTTAAADEVEKEPE